MNIYHTSLNTIFLYNPLGNTPVVCLTQDLPSEQKADILLLGCGDARNILFTSFADNSRNIDVTCCDIEPMIHARNVLLFTLLIDDKSNQNIERIWNIHHNWKLDGHSIQLLESQTEKLLGVSASIDQWHNSTYGSCIRFCDERSFSCVKRYWSGFTRKGLTSSENKDHLSQLQDAIDRAKANRRAKIPSKFNYHPTFPIGPSIDSIGSIRANEEWWDCGIAPSSTSLAIKFIHLNPAFLYSPDYQLTMHERTSPLGDVPLSTAYTPISQGSPFSLRNKSLSLPELVVDCAKYHFTQWAAAFRKSIANGSVIRIFAGDPLAFCFTLRNCQLTASNSMNLFCNNWTNSPLVLHRDYGHNKNAAPLIFDIIDTSNLADQVGILNLLVLATSLLKHYGNSCLYTELFNLYDLNIADRLNKLCGVDIRSMGLLLGLIPPDVFTNAASCIEEYPSVREFSHTGLILARSRLRWRRSAEFGSSKNTSKVKVEVKELVKFLTQVHEAMFKLESDSLIQKLPLLSEAEINKLHASPYNRASFALFLSFLKANVVSDWNECVKELYNDLYRNSSNPFKERSLEDLALYLHIFGVDDNLFNQPDRINIQNFTLASIFPRCEGSPEKLCVTVRVGRKYLKTFTHSEATLSIICSFEAKNSEGTWINSFSSLRIVFGKWIEGKRPDDLYSCIEEDSSQLFGTSDMFLSVMVPTSMLITMLFTSEPSVPLVKCGLKYSPTYMLEFGRALGLDLCFARHEILSKDVFVTEFMPGTSGLPTFTSTSNIQDEESSDTTVAKFSSDGAKINSLIKRLLIESEAAKNKLAIISSSVKVEFKSPLTSQLSISGSFKLELKFPIPVSPSRYKIRVARKSSYVEIESCLLDPLKEDTPAFLFPCSLMEVPSGTIPAAWTSTRVMLDTMPTCDLKDSPDFLWLRICINFMYSSREYQIIKSNDGYDFRASLKKGLISLFTMCAGLDGFKAKCIEIDNMGSRLKTFIIPSCFRLDLALNTIVLDCALLLLTEAAMKDPLVTKFLQECSMKGIGSVMVTQAENLAWRAMMPALVERCRTWKHTAKCKYIQAGEVPLLTGLSDDCELPICSCGIGVFPVDYAKDELGKSEFLTGVLNRYATRAAISPIFPVQYVEDCGRADLDLESCANCDLVRGKHRQSLLKCSSCHKTKYCSAECQKAHWKKHKQLCKTTKLLTKSGNF